MGIKAISASKALLLPPIHVPASRSHHTVARYIVREHEL
jgi:hypothetical protein